MNKILSLFLLLGLLQWVACVEHPREERFEHEQNKNRATTIDFTKVMSHHAEQADESFNQSIMAYEGKDFKKSAASLDEAVYHLALGGRFLDKETQAKYDDVLIHLSSMANLIRKGALSDIEQLKIGITYARLRQAKEMLYATPKDEIVAEQTKEVSKNSRTKQPPKKSTEKPMLVPITITIQENLPLLLRTISELKTASHHLTGPSQVSVNNLIDKGKALVDAALSSNGDVQKDFDALLSMFQAFLVTHRAEMDEMNKEIQASIDAEQQEQAAKIKKLKEDIAEKVAKEKAQMQEAKEEQKDKKNIPS